MAATGMLVHQGRRSDCIVTMYPRHHRLRVTTRFPPDLTGILIPTDLVQRQEAFPRAWVLRIQPQDS
jgi:hypothetical protein